MRSIKPGRGPSAMGAFGSLIMAVFGVFWTVFAMNIGAPGVFAAFGILFILAALGQLVYNLLNTTGENRMSIVDITEGGEEDDPLQRRFGAKADTAGKLSANGAYSFCPYCGQQLDGDFQFCPKCGKALAVQLR